ncbi:MAG: GTP 3',8-cyclase MoaA [Nevskiaceae bacterium]|nr:MAG: GTP 3',8-cyclase MoaA [Nevskiaceae bacterium]
MPVAIPPAVVPLRPARLQDQYGRRKRKLRVSLTDRCNLRCPYCMPDQPQWLPKAQILRQEELLRLLTLFVGELGIGELRLTGGEPLLRKDLDAIVESCGRLRALGLQRISLTSNGLLLADRAAALRRAGLDDVNVSLDALDESIFARMSGGRGSAAAVTRGIVAARDAGLPVKINTVVMRGHNEGEIPALVRWARQQRIPLRLIEFMPLDGGGAWSAERVVPEAEMLAPLRAAFSLEAMPATDEPARYYRVDGDYELGVISTISKPFCQRCDRLRLTATGELYACLFSAKGRDLRALLRDGADDAQLLAAVRDHVWHKERGYAATGYVERPISMHALGG